jgi:hypothetical protein
MIAQILNRIAGLLRARRERPRGCRAAMSVMKSRRFTAPSFPCFPPEE